LYTHGTKRSRRRRRRRLLSFNRPERIYSSLALLSLEEEGEGEEEAYEMREAGR